MNEMSIEEKISRFDKLGFAYVSTRGVPRMTFVTVPLDLGKEPLTVQFFSVHAALEWCSRCGLSVKD